MKYLVLNEASLFDDHFLSMERISTANKVMISTKIYFVVMRNLTLIALKYRGCCLMNHKHWKVIS